MCLEDVDIDLQNTGQSHYLKNAITPPFSFCRCKGTCAPNVWVPEHHVMSEGYLRTIHLILMRMCREKKKGRGKIEQERGSQIYKKPN